MGAKRDIECVIGGIADELGFFRFYIEKKLVAVHEPRAETLVYSRLPGKASGVVDCCVEWVVRRGNVKRKRGSRKLCGSPILRLKSVGEFLAVNSNLPRQQAVGLQHVPRKFRCSCSVNAGKGGKRKGSVMVK